MNTPVSGTRLCPQNAPDVDLRVLTGHTKEETSNPIIHTRDELERPACASSHFVLGATIFATKTQSKLAKKVGL